MAERGETAEVSWHRGRVVGLWLVACAIILPFLEESVPRARGDCNSATQKRQVDSTVCHYSAPKNSLAWTSRRIDTLMLTCHQFGGLTSRNSRSASLEKNVCSSSKVSGFSILGKSFSLVTSRIIPASQNSVRPVSFCLANASIV